MHNYVSGCNADEQSDQRAPASHGHIVLIGSSLVNVRTIDIVRPHGSKGAHIARHSCYEPRDESGDSKTKKSGPTVASQHQRQNLVITVLVRWKIGLIRNQVHWQYCTAK